MAKSIEELREDLKLLKEDMYQNAETLDVRLVASFVDRLIASLDELAERIESVEIAVEEVSGAEEPGPCCCCEEAPSKPKPAKKTAKKAAKKSKPAKKRKR